MHILHFGLGNRRDVKIMVDIIFHLLFDPVFDST